MTQTLSIAARAITPSRIGWTIATAALIAGGFACDGITEAGHHLLLIAGGIAAGYGIARDGR